MLQTSVWYARSGQARELSRLAAMGIRLRCVHAAGVRASQRPPIFPPSSSASSVQPTAHSDAAPSSSAKWATTAEAAAAERKERENEAVMATQVGALANVALAGGKGLIGYGVHSTALMADAANSLGDLLIGAPWSRPPA